MIDIPSLLMGKAMGGGGGGGGSSDLAVWQAGNYGGSTPQQMDNLLPTISGCNGKTVIMAVMHRESGGTLSVPSGWEFIDKSTLADRTDPAFTDTQYVSVYKKTIDSDSYQFEVSQQNISRLGISFWAFDSDVTLEKKETKEWTTNYYNDFLSFETSDLSLIIFNAFNASNAYSGYAILYPDSDGCWFNCPYGVDQLRFFTGIIPQSKNVKSSKLKISERHNYNMGTNTVIAQLIIYSISAA